MANSIGNVMERIMEYVHIKTEQIKLIIIAQVSRILASIIALSIIGVMGLFFVFFLSFSLGAYINVLLGSEFLGHLIIAGGYFLAILIIFLLMKTGKIQGWLENLILNIAEQSDEQED